MWRRVWSRRVVSLIAIGMATAMASACDPGDVSLTDASDVVGDGTALNLRVQLASGEPGPAEWSVGIPGATVRYCRTSTHGWLWTTVRADSSGTVRANRLVPGLYWVAAEAVSPADGSAFGGGEKVQVLGNEVTEAALPVFASRRGGLVISEFYSNEPPPWVYETDGESKYLEVYNNSDAAVDLAGMLVGQVYERHEELGLYNHHRCQDTEPLRADPEGVWAAVIWRFPPSAAGGSLVQPGEAVLIAVSAADHRSSHESFLDLSGADFEFLLHGIADNPAVPNMELVGTRPHRMQDFLGGQPWFIAEAQELSVLPRVRDPGGDPGNPYTDDFIRIPAATLHDVAYLTTDSYGEYTTTPPLPLCREPVFPGFDRLPGLYVSKESTLYLSIQRRPDGDRLLDTNVSAVDFRMASRTPGAID